MRNSDQKIFVSIAAYRDPELVPTIDDCLAKARYPERVRFGICWQHGTEEAAPNWFADSRFKILDVDWRESKGACWARAEIMKLWDGEEWFLQLDSHHRFAEGWDAKLLEQAEATGSPKPILTTYAGAYTPGEARRDDEPQQMNFDAFTEDGIVIFRPGPIPDWKSKKAPIRARFVSGHFLFAPGRFVKDVPYDPSLYFLGEEITLAVRAFTHGYDLFHPSEIILWHEYTRNHRTKHWDDNSDFFVERDPPSRRKAGAFLAEPHTGPFGCGLERTVAEYEAYAGLSFRHRRCQDYTRHDLVPPNPAAAMGWAERVQDRRMRIAFDKQSLPPEALSDWDFWYVAFLDAAGQEIFRQDATPSEIEELLSGGQPEIVIRREFASEAEPVSWTVWPVSKTKGWLDSLTGRAVDENRKPECSAGGSNGTSAYVIEPDRLEICYPKSAPSLIQTKVLEGYMVSVPDEPEERHFINAPGALLLELANGRHSLSEIVDAACEMSAPTPSSSCKRDTLAFFEAAVAKRLVFVEKRANGEE